MQIRLVVVVVAQYQIVLAQCLAQFAITRTNFIIIFSEKALLA